MTGQNRLSIIDVLHGDLPIVNEDGAVASVLNGEVYTFERSRDELRSAGHVLGTDGDTEILAHLVENHDGVSLARRLDGMFAFATWSERTQQLILGRDQMGKEPL